VPQSGFLGTTAPWTADVTLLLELALGTGLLAGAMLARAGRYRLHAACQSVIVLLNLALIVLTMIPAFHRQVLPKLRGRIAKPYHAFAATHAVHRFTKRDKTSFVLSHRRKVRADGFGGFTKTLAALVLHGRRETRNGEKGES
jgi:hypothetical protein